MKRLEAIVAEMESGELPLEVLIARHEEGVQLVAVCNERLDAAKKRIELVENNGGTVTTTAFGPVSTGSSESSPDEPRKGGRRSVASGVAPSDVGTPSASESDDDSLF